MTDRLSTPGLSSDEADLWFVIPTHNRRRFTEACLDSLRAQTDAAFSIAVVDDGSSDGTAEMVGSQFPGVVLLREDGNLWWARATNLGVQLAMRSGAKWVITLNDDTIPAPDFVAQMRYWARRKSQALLGAFALDAITGEAVYGGEVVDWLRARHVPLSVPAEKRSGLHAVSHFPGRGLLVPAVVYARIGLYDDRRFPHLLADYDFTHRAVRAGFEVYCNYDARLRMFPQASRSALLRANKTIPAYLEYLFGRRGAGHLGQFVLYAMRNCPPRYLAPYLVIGILRRLVGYFLH